MPALRQEDVPGRDQLAVEHPRALRWLAALIALVPFLLLVWRFDFVCDDAFISFRFADNLARGEGLRFNLGEQPPVEGYSEFGWVLAIAAGIGLNIAPWVTARVLSVLAGALLVVLVTGAIARVAQGRRVATLGGALVVGTLVPLAVWSTSGMGTSAFLLAAFGLHVALFGARPRLAAATLAAVAVVLLRADGAYWVALSGTTGLVLGRSRPELRRAALSASAVAAAVFFAHMGWRYSVYGDWLPNTARVKVGLSGAAVARGSEYLAGFLAAFPGVLFAIVMGLVWGRRREAATAIALVGSLVYPLLVGGDFMCFGRFVLPALPLAALLFAGWLASLEERGSAFPASATAAVVALGLLPAYDLHAAPRALRAPLTVRHNAPVFRSEFGQWKAMKDNAARWEVLGKALKQHTRPEATIVTGGIGAVGYFSERFLYDQNGLITREVALGPLATDRRSPGHDKAVPPEFFLKDNPTFLRVELRHLSQPPPQGVVESGPGRDLVRALDPKDGFPEGYVLIGYRPR